MAVLEPSGEIPIVADSVVIIKKVSDFGTITSNVVIPRSDVTYFIDGVIDMGEVTIETPPNGVSIYSDDLNVKGLYSTADNYTMFTSPAGSYSGNASFQSMFLNASGTNSKIFDLDNDGNFGAIEFTTVNIGNFGYDATTSFGELTDYRQAFFNGVGFINYGDGLTFNGTWAGLTITDSIALLAPAGSTLLKEGTNLTFSDGVRIGIKFDSTDATSVLLDFDEANILAAGGLSLKNVRTSATNAVPNITGANVNSRFSDNQGIRNTYIGGQWGVTTEATTTIPAVDTPVKVAGTTTYADLQHFTGDADNAFTYIGTQNIEVEIKGLLSISGGNNDQVQIFFRKWDNSASAYVDLPKSTATLNGGGSGNRAEGVGVFGYTDMDENDRIEVWIQNISDSSNVTAVLGGLVSVTER